MPSARRKKVIDAFGTASIEGGAITALFISPISCERRKVQVPGIPIQEGYSPFSEYEAQHLFSEDDEGVKLRYHPGLPSRGGSSGGGAGGYLAPEKPARKEKLEEDAQAEKKPRAKPEPYTGYLIVINTAEFSSTFNQKSGVYDVSEHGRLTNPDIPPKLKKKTVRSVKDIVDTIRFGDMDMLLNSLVVFQNNPVSWDQFCIRMGTPSRQLDLLKRAQQRKEKQEPPFALVEIRTTRRHDPTPRWDHKDTKKNGKVPPAPVDPIEIEYEGKKTIIQYDVYIDDQRAEKHAKYSLQKAATYFVLAEVRYWQEKSENGIIHHLSLKVTNEAQIMMVNIENLDRDARMTKAEKRAMQESEKPGPITIPKDWDPGRLTGE